MTRSRPRRCFPLRARRAWPLLAAAALAACTDGAGPSADFDLPAPALLDDGWSVATPEEAGLDADRLDLLARRIEAGELLHVHSLLVARHGDLVFEGYFHEHERDRLHVLQSVTKSVASTLVGIARDEGLLDLDATLPELLPSRAGEMADDPRKGEIRLRDLLTMRAGLEWDEWSCPYTDPSCNSNRQMNQAEDWIGYVLAQPVVTTPGTEFVYNSGASNLLAAVLAEATGEDPVDFARTRLFEPLGIEEHHWGRNTAHPDSLPHFGGGLALRSRDLAKLGQLFLDRGTWNGTRVVSEDWVEESGAFRTVPFAPNGYGFQWWMRPLSGVAGHSPEITDVRYGWGYGGQHVFVVPALDLVIATQSWNDDGATRGFEIFDAVVAAVR